MTPPWRLPDKEDAMTMKTNFSDQKPALLPWWVSLKPLEISRSRKDLQKSLRVFANFLEACGGRGVDAVAHAGTNPVNIRDVCLRGTGAALAADGHGCL